MDFSAVRNENFWNENNIEDICEEYRKDIIDTSYSHDGYNFIDNITQKIGRYDEVEYPECNFSLAKVLLYFYDINHKFHFSDFGINITLLGYFCGEDFLIRADIIDYLLSRGANPNIADHPYHLPIFRICRGFTNNIDTLRKLLDAGADCNITYFNQSLTYFSLLNGNWDYVYLMQGYGLNINNYLSDDNSPLTAMLKYYGQLYRPCNPKEFIENVQKFFENGYIHQLRQYNPIDTLENNFNANIATLDPEYADVYDELRKYFLTF